MSREVEEVVRSRRVQMKASALRARGRRGSDGARGGSGSWCCDGLGGESLECRAGAGKNRGLRGRWAEVQAMCADSVS